MKIVLLEKNLVQTNVTMLPAIYDDDALILYFLSYDVQKLVTSLWKLYQAITIKRRHQFQPIGGNWLSRLGSNSVAKAWNQRRSKQTQCERFSVRSGGGGFKKSREEKRKHNGRERGERGR